MCQERLQLRPVWGPLLGMTDLGARKDDHLDLALRADVGFRRTTLLEEVELVHSSLPELAWEEIDLSLRIFGKRVRAPVLIAGMTGGSERSKEINQKLAEVAESRGLALGLGSQRAMVKTGRVDPQIAASYQVRNIAPTIPILANIGAVQARDMPIDLIQALIDSVGADALCVHLNPAQELIQSDGDRDFRGCLERIAELVGTLGTPIVVKETGNGISASVARKLRAVGVVHLDVSGSGGTSWVGVETHRAKDEERQRGELFWDWGIPTAASLLQVTGERFETVIATGGIQNGLDVARALALGAHAAGMARPVLHALDQGGVARAARLLERVENEVRTAMLLTGSKNAADLRAVPRVLGPRLSAWQTKRP